MKQHFLALAVWLLSAHALAEPFAIASEPITQFKIGSDETRFGSLDFLGGLSITSHHKDFGGISGIRFIRDNDIMLITDKARIITAKLVRKENSPAALGEAHISRIKWANGRTITGKYDKDSEALEISGDSYFVGFERNDRLMRFSRQNRTLVAHRNYSVDFNPKDLPNNRGPEAIALDPRTGAMFVFAENARNETGNHRGFVVADGEIIRELSVKRRNGFSLTDAAFLPDGNLLLLERYYIPFISVYMRIRKIAADALAGSEPLDGEILLDVNSAYEIDNMEGLAISKMADGSHRLTLVSDDNFSENQRTILLEFRLN